VTYNGENNKVILGCAKFEVWTVLIGGGPGVVETRQWAKHWQLTYGSQDMFSTLLMCTTFNRFAALTISIFL